ncbi:uncharacterized protein K460DRAFT_287249 [Cucurbitaria berberidis CBS 394.84]|uniref:F-box domain-containing protein n=1 Tax=Cucurbitaria berberidis CBS 394.84 TaxID=1168544 RepID=A0A9P4GEQ8_9PLEO|nr:uncharacterized protein K460DRAFT_287249 [Cucurbitaria berberidis CBS 394.84]KAF1844017.1 hypothetical protein K460DRAFT_287249 [Cucurbitaria berberidis CBS 394.84]
MTELFDLPTELLFQIIHLVLSSRHSVSPNGLRCRTEWKGTRRNVTCCPSRETLWTPSALNLLLVSQRLYAETMLYLSKKPQSFKFDVAVVNNHWIWPTWRSTPIRSRSHILDRVDIELILSCSQDERNLQTQWMLQPEDACADTELVLLLCQFILLEGPLVTHINTLRINIDTTRYGNGNELISLEEVPLRRINGLAHLDFDKLYPIDYHVSFAFLRRLYTRTGAMLEALQNNPDIELPSQRIGKVLFCIDGKVLMQIDVAKHVAG